MTITLCNMKGGVGKTTLAVNLGCIFQASGNARVTLLDLDAQESSRSWVEFAKLPLTVATEGSPKELKDSGADVLIIDTPGNLHALSTQQAISVADVVLIPCTPAPSDLDPTRRTVQAVKELTKAPALIVVNRHFENTITGRDAETWIKGFGVPVAKTWVHQREQLKRVFLTGWASSGEVREELDALAVEIVKLTR